MPGKGLGIFSPPAEGSASHSTTPRFSLQEIAPHTPISGKKKAPSQRGEGARGLSGWLTGGPTGKLPTAMVSSAFLPPISSPLFLSKGGGIIVAKK
jgi:hypothetical protein